MPRGRQEGRKFASLEQQHHRSVRAAGGALLSCACSRDYVFWTQVELRHMLCACDPLCVAQEETRRIGIHSGSRKGCRLHLCDCPSWRRVSRRRWRTFCWQDALARVRKAQALPRDPVRVGASLIHVWESHLAVAGRCSVCWLWVQALLRVPPQSWRVSSVWKILPRCVEAVGHPRLLLRRQG